MARARISMLALATALLLGGASLATASPIGIMLAFGGGVDLGIAGGPDHQGGDPSGPGIHAGVAGNNASFDFRPGSNALALTSTQSGGHAFGGDEQALNGNGGAGGAGENGLDFTERGFAVGPEDGHDEGRGGLQLAEAITNGPGVDSLASDYFRIVGDLRPPPVFSTAPENPPVPEPATLAMLLGGLASLLLLGRRPAPAKVAARS